ncbi:hypothetical protein CVT24_008146 [Panaeolus cyanescens]|uniref:Uncharacterized protein n=1 Tax=Panaeolus cyanescens TaxID=181874 RepID=A0A409YLG9_9AGAR|nr:hypothetical protein CVT24_008146 [Panaeolus cyanescens]
MSSPVQGASRLPSTAISLCQRSHAPFPPAIIPPHRRPRPQSSLLAASRPSLSSILVTIVINVELDIFANCSPYAPSNNAMSSTPQVTIVVLIVADTLPRRCPQRQELLLGIVTPSMLVITPVSLPNPDVSDTQLTSIITCEYHTIAPAS